MANAERLIPYLEQLLRCPFHIGRDLLLDFFSRGLLQLVDNFPDTLAARTSPRIRGECLGGFAAWINNLKIGASSSACAGSDRNTRCLLRVLGKRSKEASDENRNCHPRRSFPRRHSGSG